VAIQDDHPVPKIIDFGVAKATAQHLTERTLFTELGVLIGTPEYMSPEQAEMGGLDIDTRTDVYALGVMLYELLTGALPFGHDELRRAGLMEIQRTIREKDPPRPSTRVTQLGPASSETAHRRHTDPARLASDLRGDLDWITMKALEKDRTRRYDTVMGLANDVQRHLQNEPVMASPPSTTYRVRKFARRHRFGVAGAATLVILLVTFATTMAVQAQRIARERDRANREAAAAKQVSDFLVGLFQVSDPSLARGRSVTAREILAAGAAKINQSLRDQPDVQARLQMTMGSVFDSLGLYEDGGPLLRQALDTRRRILGDDSPDTLEVMILLASHLWYEGKYSDAETLYSEVVDRRKRLLGERHPDTVAAYSHLATTYLMEGRLKEAEQFLVKVVGLQREVLGDDDGETLLSMNNLQGVYFRQKRYQEALPLALKVWEGRRRVSGNDHPLTLRASHNLATIYDALRRDAEAESLYLATIASERRVLGPSHDATARTMRRLGLMYQRQQRYPEAEPLLVEASAYFSNALGMRNADTEAVIGDVIALYEAWAKPDKAGEWRKKLTEATAKKTP
jgi:eukaryotic-like serine/threonine-protein kinase